VRGKEPELHLGEKGILVRAKTSNKELSYRKKGD